MPNGLRNWTYKDLSKFLKSRNFKLDYMKKGSHEFWINREKDKIVNVNRTNATYPIKTLETMITQSGIPKKEWLA